MTFSLSLQYFTVLIPWPPRLPGGGAGEFGVLPVLLSGRPIQSCATLFTRELYYGRRPFVSRFCGAKIL